MVGAACSTQMRGRYTGLERGSAPRPLPSHDVDLRADREM